VVEPHDAFANAAGERAALRLVPRWSQGTTRRSAIKTRYPRLADRLIVAEFAGPNTFQLAELNQWGLAPADTGKQDRKRSVATDGAGSRSGWPPPVPTRHDSPLPAPTLQAAITQVGAMPDEVITHLTAATIVPGPAHCWRCSASRARSPARAWPPPVQAASGGWQNGPTRR
jgi:hypothetical protein